MNEISNYWKKRDGYTLIEAGYLVLGMPPKSPEIDLPYEVLKAIEDIRNIIKTISIDEYTKIESGNDFISRNVVVNFATYYGVTDFFKDDPLVQKSLITFGNSPNEKQVISDHEPSNKFDLQQLKSWNDFEAKTLNAINKYPQWSAEKTISKSGNLMEWLALEIKSDTREAEIIKRFLTEKFKI